MCRQIEKRNIPLHLPFMQEWQLWNVCFFCKGCDSVQLQEDDRKRKAAQCGIVWYLSLPGLISHVELCGALAETSGSFIYFFWNTSAFKIS